MFYDTNFKKKVLVKNVPRTLQGHMPVTCISYFQFIPKSIVI